jgi:hypothetical protein
VSVKPNNHIALRDARLKVARYRKSADERALIERLRLLYPWFPPGHTSTGDYPPDFVHCSGDDRIAIEVTRLFHPPDRRGHERRAGESHRRQIMQRAEARARAEHLPVLDVLVHFADQELDREATAHRLIEFVKAHPVEWCETFNNVEGLGVVRIARPLVGVVPRWNCAEGGHEPVLTYEQLDARIQRKNRDLPRYRANFNHTWLLIASTLFPLSASFGIPGAIEQWAFNFDFDKVLLLSEPSGKVFNLRRASIS